MHSHPLVMESGKRVFSWVSAPEPTWRHASVQGGMARSSTASSSASFGVSVARASVTSLPPTMSPAVSYPQEADLATAATSAYLNGFE